MEEILDKIIEQRNQILDREVVNFLEKYKLPVDREELRKKGYVLNQIIHTNNFPTSETFEFQLCKIIEEKTLKVEVIFDHDQGEVKTFEVDYNLVVN